MQASWLLLLLLATVAVVWRLPYVSAASEESGGGNGNGTEDELEALGEAADYLLEMHHFFDEYERLKAQSRAEQILQDAFSPVFTKVAAVRDEVGRQHLEAAAACVADAEEGADQTLADVQGLLADCYNVVVPEGEEVQEAEELRQEVADFLQVVIQMLQYVSGSDPARSNKQVSDALSARAIALARNFLRTRELVRNCIDLQLGEAYRLADQAEERAATCLLAEHHDEL